MNVSINTAAFEINVTDNYGNVVFSHSGENIKTTIDVGCALAMLSTLAHQFKQLDATHNVRSDAVSTPVCDKPVAQVPVGERRPKQVTRAMEAITRFHDRAQRYDEAGTRHDLSMAIYDAKRDVRDNASADNIGELKRAVAAYTASFADVEMNERAVLARDTMNELLAAI